MFFIEKTGFRPSFFHIELPDLWNEFRSNAHSRAKYQSKTCETVLLEKSGDEKRNSSPEMLILPYSDRLTSRPLASILVFFYYPPVESLPPPSLATTPLSPTSAIHLLRVVKLFLVRPRKSWPMCPSCIARTFTAMEYSSAKEALMRA